MFRRSERVRPLSALKFRRFSVCLSLRHRECVYGYLLFALTFYIVLFEKLWYRMGDLVCQAENYMLWQLMNKNIMHIHDIIAFSTIYTR